MPASTATADGMENPRDGTVTHVETRINGLRVPMICPAQQECNHKPDLVSLILSPAKFHIVACFIRHLSGPPPAQVELVLEKAGDLLTS